MGRAHHRGNLSTTVSEEMLKLMGVDDIPVGARTQKSASCKVIPWMTL